MKITHKHNIPEQRCRVCKSYIKLKYKDLRYDGQSMCKSNWKCPLCKCEQNVIFLNLYPKTLEQNNTNKSIVESL